MPMLHPCDGDEWHLGMTVQNQLDQFRNERPWGYIFRPPPTGRTGWVYIHPVFLVIFEIILFGSQFLRLH